MTIAEATDKQSWDTFLAMQPWSPFLQSWTMGSIYEAIGEKIIRLEATENGKTAGICLAHVVEAKRGRHLAIPYGPVIADEKSTQALAALMEKIKRIAREHGCSFIRMSPFWQKDNALRWSLSAIRSPLHLLAEHLWILDLQNKTEEGILMAMRKTTRNLIRRAEREGVTVRASKNPDSDIRHFLALHEETKKRHHFTPYTDAFFRAQLSLFAREGHATLYLAEYGGNIIASSIHMHFGGETSYHHGASTAAYEKIPASYLLQWAAIRDALKRGDHIYNFWGIAPELSAASFELPEKNSKLEARSSKLHTHPFAGITTFKTGFGGDRLELTPCMDIPLSNRYYLTRAFEALRKWRRGF